MAINTLFNDSASQNGGETRWYRIDYTDLPFTVTLLPVGGDAIAEIINYTGAVMSFSFTSANGTVLSTGATADTNTASSGNYFSSVITVPAGAVYLVATCTSPTLFSIRTITTKPVATFSPTLYTNTQSITLNATSVVTLLGGGGAGGSGTQFVGGGGGSGFITNGLVNAGTYGLVIGAGASAGGGGGGTTTFAGLSAAGGGGASSSAAGNGGSNGANGGGNLVRGGENGNPGSGVSPVLFVGGLTSSPGSSSGGGIYAGGAQGNINVVTNGGGANGLGGGGGGAMTNSTNVGRTGGGGGGGALWVLPAL